MRPAEEILRELEHLRAKIKRYRTHNREVNRALLIKDRLWRLASEARNALIRDLERCNKQANQLHDWLKESQSRSASLDDELSSALLKNRELKIENQMLLLALSEIAGDCVNGSDALRALAQRTVDLARGVQRIKS